MAVNSSSPSGFEWLGDAALGFLSMNIPHVAGSASNVVLTAITRERVVVNKEISTHVLESGSYVSDHIIDQPLTIYIEGIVALKESKPLIETLGIEDVNLYQGLKVNHVFSLIGLIDTTAGLYALPGQNDNWLTYTKKAIDIISKKASEGFQKTYGVFEDFVNYFLKNTINKVAETFKLYKKIADSRLPLKYTTQYGAYENLYISQIESVTDSETGQFAAKVNLKLEELKFVQSIYAPIDQALEGRIKSQFSSLVDKGTIKLNAISVPDYAGVFESINKAAK